MAMPTYINHWDKTVNLISYLNNSTSILPDCISISCSSATKEIIEQSENIAKNSKIELIFSFSLDIQGAWFNRNVASSKLKTDIISFFDGDDIPHPQRTEILKACFEDNNDINAIVHDYYYQEGYLDLSVFNQIKLQDVNLEKNIIKDVNENCLHPVFNGVFFSSPVFHKPYHNAHVSIKKNILEKVKYKDLPYVEDNTFNSDIIRSGYKISYISNKLSIYNKFF